jgi:hypothetical protein
MSGLRAAGAGRARGARPARCCEGGRPAVLQYYRLQYYRAFPPPSLPFPLRVPLRYVRASRKSSVRASDTCRRRRRAAAARRARRHRAGRSLGDRELLFERRLFFECRLSVLCRALCCVRRAPRGLGLALLAELVKQRHDAHRLGQVRVSD